MLPMKLLTSSCVGQDFWQGASAHLRQRPASLKAALSLSEVCLMSSKFLKRVEHDLKVKSGFTYTFYRFLPSIQVGPSGCFLPLVVAKTRYVNRHNIML